VKIRLRYPSVRPLLSVYAFLNAVYPE